MNRSKTLVAVLALVHLLITAASAQPGTRATRAEGWGADGAYNKIYDPKSTESIRGQVVSVERITPMAGMGPGLHLSLKTQYETIPVHLGPSWFIERQDVEIERNEEVEVTGSRVMLDGKPAIIAAEVKKNDQVLELRDGKGRPVWAAWRPDPRRRGMMGPGMMSPGMMERRMMGRGMGPEMMEERRHMMEEHSRMMSEWKSMEAELERHVARMNEAEGEEKIQAIADVINELVDQRKQMAEHMAAMHSRMMAHMQHMQGMTELEPTGRNDELPPQTQPETDPR